MPSPAAATATRRYRGSPPAERRAERRERLLQAAVRVYGERGYRNATVKAVCEEAGLTERYFYESFENSEALLVASFRHVTQDLLHKLEEAGAATPRAGREKLRGILERYYRALRNDPLAARLFLVEVAGVSPALDRAFEASIEAFGDLIGETIAGAGARSDPLLRAGAVGGVLRIALTWIADGYRRPVAEVADTALSIAMILKKNGAADRSA